MLPALMPPARLLHLSVIIPAFNEEGVIELHADRVASFLHGHLTAGQDFEVLVVDDGSIDSTAAILAGMQASRPWLRTVRHPRNAGRGKALRTGFAAARGAFIVTLDADLSYSPDHIARLLAPLERGTADVVLASAYHPQGSVRNVPFGRAMLSRLGNLVLSQAVGGGIHTATCVVRAYTREVLDHLILFGNGKDLHLEIIQKARILGFRVVEVPADLCWLPVKRSRAAKGMSLGDLWSLSRRHLFYNFLMRPTSLFVLPLLLFAIVFAATSVAILLGYSHQYAAMEGLSGLSRAYQALRANMQGAPLSYVVWGLSLVLLLQFLSLNLMSKQSNHHYEEMLRHVSRLERLARRAQGPGDE